MAEGGGDDAPGGRADSRQGDGPRADATVADNRASEGAPEHLDAAPDTGTTDGAPADSRSVDATTADGGGSEPYQVCWSTFHSCAWKTHGPVYCWGSNHGGELGTGNQDVQPFAVIVQGLHDVKKVAAGGDAEGFDGHTCAIDGANSLWCWGWNRDGQLGLGDAQNRPVPTVVSGITGVVDVQPGDSHTCALDDQGAVWCWGAYLAEQLGATESDVTNLPSRVVTPHDAVEIAIGTWHGCLRTAAGQIRCWGQNAYGEVASGDTMSQATPVVVPGIDDAVQISAGTQFSCALSRSRGVLCWGWSFYAEGPGRSAVTAPTPIVGLPSGIVAIAQHAPCALDSSGAVWCWGPLPPTIDQTVRNASRKQGFDDVASIAGFCGATHGGQVRCFGFNTEYQLGNGSMDASDAAVPVSLP